MKNTNEFTVKKVSVVKQDLDWPDIDVDVDGNKREELVDYLIKKYGQNNVSYVGNILQYAPKSVIRDLGQVYDIPSKELFKCTKEYNDNMTVRENMEVNKTSRIFFNNYPEIIDRVDKIVGTVSSLGVHAGGVVITDKRYPLKKYCALQRPNETGRVATLWTKDLLQPIGLVKYDILGLTTAGQNHLIKEMIGMNPYEDFNDDDPDVYRDVVLGLKHKNIFQFETQLGRQAFVDLMPMSFMELANASSIIRVVGSTEGREAYNQYKKFVEQYHLGNVNDWKNEIRNEIIEEHNYDVCVDVLHESFGILIYQEQLSYLVIGFSKGKKNFTDGNKVRKTLENHSKKYGSLDKLQGNREALRKWHGPFMEIMNEYFLPYLGRDGRDSKDKDLQAFLNFKLTRDNILPTPKTGIISWLISASAYLFSKLHAVAYTMNTYNAMYLKHHHPLQFWCGSLVYERNDLSKVKSYLTAIKLETDIKILPPNVNYSKVVFTIEKDAIRYGLGGIMNVGEAAYEIERERNNNGKFKNLQDFFKRVNKKHLNKRVIEALLYVNAFADFGKMNEVYTQLVDVMNVKLGTLETNRNELAMIESKYLGVALTNIHPLTQIAAAYLPITMVEENDSAEVACYILEIKNKISKNQKPYSMLRCQCLNSLEVFNIFDWNNNQMGFRKGEFNVLNIINRNGFYQLKMSTSFSGKKRTSAAFYDSIKKMRNGK